MYAISRWIESDNACESGVWRLWARRKTRRGTIRQIRKLCSMGYDRDVSISVDVKAPTGAEQVKAKETQT